MKGTEMEWHFVCPKGWRVIERYGDGYACLQAHGGLRAIVDCSEKSDGYPWIHVSYSRKLWTPSHEDTCNVKKAFLGDRYAYAVFPPPEKYVNIMPYCLHLWARLDGSPVLPEFSEFVDGVGLSI